MLLPAIPRAQSKDAFSFGSFQAAVASTLNAAFKSLAVVAIPTSCGGTHRICAIFQTLPMNRSGAMFEVTTY
jgi:hypothetical protein